MNMQIAGPAVLLLSCIAASVVAYEPPPVDSGKPSISVVQKFIEATAERDKGLAAIWLSGGAPYFIEKELMPSPEFQAAMGLHDEVERAVPRPIDRGVESKSAGAMSQLQQVIQDN